MIADLGLAVCGRVKIDKNGWKEMLDLVTGDLTAMTGSAKVAALIQCLWLWELRRLRWWGVVSEFVAVR